MCFETYFFDQSNMYIFLFCRWIVKTLPMNPLDNAWPRPSKWLLFPFNFYIFVKNIFVQINLPEYNPHVLQYQWMQLQRRALTLGWQCVNGCTLEIRFAPPCKKLGYKAFDNLKAFHQAKICIKFSNYLRLIMIKNYQCSGAIQR